MQGRLIWYKRTFIASLKVVVSTVKYNMEIGLDRNAETMVFQAESVDQFGASELYFESHDHLPIRALRREHNRIVRDIRKGEIKLDTAV